MSLTRLAMIDNVPRQHRSLYESGRLSQDAQVEIAAIANTVVRQVVGMNGNDVEYKPCSRILQAARGFKVDQRTSPCHVVVGASIALTR